MEKSCGAKTRAGGTCKKPPLNGKTRCKLHGGASISNTNAATHGIYQQHLTDNEREQYNGLTLGAVDHELRLMRIRLARALAAEQASNGLPELDEITENEGAGEYVAKETRKRKMRDYVGIIDKTAARIESLEKTRKALAESGNQAGDDMDREDTFIAPDEAIPDAPIL